MFLCSWVVTMAHKCVSTCQDVAWHTILSSQLTWHAPISVEQARLVPLSTIWVFLSAASCTERHWRFVQPREKRVKGVGSPIYCLQVASGELQGRCSQVLNRGAQQKTRGNNHKEQPGKFWLKKFWQLKELFTWRVDQHQSRCPETWWDAHPWGMKPDWQKCWAPWSDYPLSWRLDQLVSSSLNHLSHGRLKAHCSHCVVGQGVQGTRRLSGEFW